MEKKYYPGMTQEQIKKDIISQLDEAKKALSEDWKKGIEDFFSEKLIEPDYTANILRSLADRLGKAAIAILRQD